MGLPWLSLPTSAARGSRGDVESLEQTTYGISCVQMRSEGVDLPNRAASILVCMRGAHGSRTKRQEARGLGGVQLRGWLELGAGTLCVRILSLVFFCLWDYSLLLGFSLTVRATLLTDLGTYPFS